MVITEAIKNEDKIISNDTQKLIDTIDLKNQQLQNIVNEIKDIGMEQVSQNKINATILIQSTKPTATNTTSTTSTTTTPSKIKDPTHVEKIY